MHSSLLFKSAKSTLLNINCSELNSNEALYLGLARFLFPYSVVPQIRVRSVVKMESGGEYVCASHFPPAEAVSRRAHAAHAPSRNPPTLAARTPHAGDRRVIVHDSGHVLRDVKFSLDEGPTNDELQQRRN